jgi:hypothetical protein
MKANYETQERNNNPMKTKILRNLFLSLSAIFASAITAHAQNLYVAAHTPRDGAIPPLNLGVHAIWRAEHLRFTVVVPPRVGL